MVDHGHDRDSRRLRFARIVQTVRGKEVRCPEHDHLLGVINEAGQLVIKCRREEYVVVEDDEAQ